MNDDLEMLASTLPIQDVFKSFEYEVIHGIVKHIADIGKGADRQSSLTAQGQAANNMDKWNVHLENACDLANVMVDDLFQHASEQMYESLGIDTATNTHPVTGIELPQTYFNKLEETLQSVAAPTKAVWENLSDTRMLATLDAQGNRIRLDDAYRVAIDRAIRATREYEEDDARHQDFHDAVASTIRNLADGGVRRIEWASGYTQRLDTAVRRNILGGLAELYMRQSDDLAQELGADGMEITWHDGYRPSHDWGGQQFAMLAFNNEIRPQLKEPNCYHRAFPIFFGITEPIYTKEELRERKAANAEKHEFEGQMYNRYEAEQQQRKYEAEIRKTKDRIAAFEVSGDERRARIENMKLTRLENEYVEFSGATNLPPRLNRMLSMFDPHPTNLIVSDTSQVHNFAFDIAQRPDLVEDLRGFIPANWAGLSVQERTDAVHTFAHILGNELDIPVKFRPTVHLREYPEEQGLTLGEYVPPKNNKGAELHINEAFVHTHGAVPSMVNTIAHEMWHARQHGWTVDPLPSYREQYTWLLANNIPVDIDYAMYENQLIEQEAREYGKLLEEALVYTIGQRSKDRV